MRLLSPSVSSSNGWAKDLIKPFMTAESEDATAEIFEGDEWVDFRKFSSIVGEKESYFRGFGSDGGDRTLNDRESFWLKHTENRDEQSSNSEFDKFDKADDETREQLESVSQPRSRAITRRHRSNHHTTTIVQKWEAIIRSNHGVGKRIELDGTDEYLSRLHRTRSVGGLTSNSISPKPTRVRRSFGLRDITNSLNPKSSNTSTSKDGETDFSHTNKSTFRVSSRRSISNGVTNCSNTTEPTKRRRSFGLGEIMASTTPVNSPDATGHSITSKPPKGRRRSFGLKDFNVNFSTISSSNITKNISSGNSEPISREKTSHSVRKSDLMIRQFLQTSRSNSNNGDNSFDNKSPKNQTATSSDSDDSGFKRLLNLWNRRSEDDEIPGFHSYVQNQKSPTRVKAVDEGDAIKNSSNYIEDSRFNSNILKRLTAARNTLKHGLSNGLVDSENYEESKSNGDKKPMRVLVVVEQDNKCDPIVGEAQEDHEGEEQLVIHKNLTLKTEGIECECSESAFSGREDLISFFLPKMGMACACGRNRNELTNPNDPTALENILRPWQAEFLKSCFDIHRGEQLVKARRRSAGIMARGLRQWRKKNGMASFKTSSCATALHIWSKVCKSYVRSIRRQTLAGKEDLQLGPADAALFSEMSQFLGDLPAAPKRRDRASNNVLGIEPESQVEV